MIYPRTRGRRCIALVHFALKEDPSQWFWCKKIWFVSIWYWSAELASSPVVTSDKWPYLLCYYVQHNHARNSQRNIEPTLHWLHGLHLFQELKDVFCQYSAKLKVEKESILTINYTFTLKVFFKHCPTEECSTFNFLFLSCLNNDWFGDE